MDEKVKEIREYVRHLKVLCPTTLEVQYFEYLLSLLSEKDKKIKTLEGELRKTISVNELSLANQDLEARIKELTKEKHICEVCWQILEPGGLPHTKMVIYKK